MNRLEQIDCRFPKAEILRKKKDFDEVFEKGRIWNGRYIKCLFVRSNRRMVGFLISGRFGNAVRRNRARRLMREVYRKNRHSLGLYKIVIILKSCQQKLYLQELEIEFNKFSLCIKPLT